MHQVQCRGTEPHLARCPTQLAPPAPQQHACPRGMHAVVSCVPGPAFQQGKGRGKKPPRKASLGKVSPGTAPYPLRKAPGAGQHPGTPLHLLMGPLPVPGPPRAPASGCPRW